MATIVIGRQLDLDGDEFADYAVRSGTCADALVDAERRIEARIAERIPPGLRRDLEHLLEETAVQQPVGVGGIAARLELPEPDEPRPARRRPSLPIGSRGCAGRGSATSPTGSVSSRTTAASRFSRSAPEPRRHDPKEDL